MRIRILMRFFIIVPFNNVYVYDVFGANRGVGSDFQGVGSDCPGDDGVRAFPDGRSGVVGVCRADDGSLSVGGAHIAVVTARLRVLPTLERLRTVAKVFFETPDSWVCVVQTRGVVQCSVLAQTPRTVSVAPRTVSVDRFATIWICDSVPPAVDTRG